MSEFLPDFSSLFWLLSAAGKTVTTDNNYFHKPHYQTFKVQKCPFKFNTNDKHFWNISGKRKHLGLYFKDRIVRWFKYSSGSSSKKENLWTDCNWAGYVWTLEMRVCEVLFLFCYFFLFWGDPKTVVCFVHMKVIQINKTSKWELSDSSWEV